MRALGPGSVSSVLKIVLDVVYYVLILAAASVSLGILVVLLLSFDPDLMGGRIHIDNIDIRGPWMGPAAAAVLLAADLYVAGAVVIVGRLRRLFLTLIAGDPFHPDNVRRLRVIGAALAALEIGRWVASVLAQWAFPGRHTGLNGGLNLTTWFAVLVIIVLAEVFREGARLRREAELTI